MNRRGLARLVALSVATIASSVAAEPSPGIVIDVTTGAPGAAIGWMTGSTAVNLRVQVRCAEYVATPDRGLSVRVDGVPRPADTSAELLAASYGVAWRATDAGYAVEPGRHQVVIAAPGCVELTRDIEISPTMPTFVSGRLPSDAATSTPVTAPDGFGFSLGAISRTRPGHGGRNDTFETDYAFDGTSIYGGMLSASYERRVLVTAVDLVYGGASVSGTASYKGTIDPDPTPVPFTGSAFVIGTTIRVGARYAIGKTALAAGSGIGADLVIINARLDKSMSLAASPSDGDAVWFVPVWTTLTIKPWCDWGVQVMPSYDIHPTSTRENGLSITAALLWQPASACSAPSGLVVR